ncbi:MAG: hypothetical protein EOS65_18315 [Mesorhizobium sp.]|uniref:hypothetical protein n=1 Tax=Mesorhizobium sp. TaxID=1871066 RepID=UPI000FD1B484|nr:hypothetical protein [Mesorhizobium sp.]RVC60110.1 hypothetical protein EN779_14295 [Mesorhizobium sp. M4B.F.Ca.ET.088.02.2.1]RWF32129.1 MAG: hypothetical protein EOS45_08570 [Mesorhizobium sp.]RWF39753.1 MAG: hypothetical protein EOS65_18315 [Mesorhizobium sp.]TIX15502.1 MAG: hypothetical protein E5V41_15790 [Mesorhizobium sp.]TIX42317.1 MAG: hypothetical protein E5V40_07260 [Mesorhizobium sp.]
MTNNWHAPEMFSQLFASGNHTDQTAQDSAITQILQTAFPVGTVVSDVKSSLSKEGFQDIPPPPLDCVPPAKEAEVLPRTVHTPCYDVRDQMEYQWMIGGICRAHIFAKWMTGETGRVSQIQGYGSTACL